MNTHTGPAQPAAAARQTRRSAGENWLSTLDAVQQCLSSTARGPRMAGDRPREMQAVMRGCAGALAQLRESLTDVMRQDAAQAAALASEVARLRDALIESEQAERRASHAARHDALTRLPNRACFTAELETALQVCSVGQVPLAVLFIDLDQFKPVNDAHGHRAGDELLRIVALRLRRTMRAQDLVCRFGGDEFACLLPGLDDVPQLRRIAGSMREAVAAPLRLAGDLQLQARASIGVARAPQDGLCPESLLRHADAAMYRAKRDGSGLAF